MAKAEDEKNTKNFCSYTYQSYVKWENLLRVLNQHHTPKKYIIAIRRHPRHFKRTAVVCEGVLMLNFCVTSEGFSDLEVVSRKGCGIVWG